jgi:hypothetical protein
MDNNRQMKLWVIQLHLSVIVNTHRGIQLHFSVIVHTHRVIQGIKLNAQAIAYCLGFKLNA